MEPIGIFILAMICQVYSCAANVSDSVERMQYASVAGEEYLQGDRLETNLDDKVYFDFDKSILDAEDKSLLEQYLPEIKKAKIVRLEGHCDERGTREYNLAKLYSLVPLSSQCPSSRTIFAFLISGKYCSNKLLSSASRIDLSKSK